MTLAGLGFPPGILPQRRPRSRVRAPPHRPAVAPATTSRGALRRLRQTWLPLLFRCAPSLGAVDADAPARLVPRAQNGQDSPPFPDDRRHCSLPAKALQTEVGPLGLSRGKRMPRVHALHAVDRRLALPTGEDMGKADPRATLVVRREGPAGRGPPLPALWSVGRGPRGGVRPFPRSGPSGGARGEGSAPSRERRRRVRPPLPASAGGASFTAERPRARRRAGQCARGAPRWRRPCDRRRDP